MMRVHLMRAVTALLADMTLLWIIPVNSMPMAAQLLSVAVTAETQALQHAVRCQRSAQEPPVGLEPPAL
jgi:hypothetical protein